MINRFEDIVIFQQARELSKAVYTITRECEFRFDTRFVQQIRAASGSIMDNIAEGFERDGNKEFIQFLYVSKGSCGELRSQLLRAHDVGFIPDSKFEELYNACIRLSKGISNFIRSLRESQIKGKKYQSSPFPPETPPVP